MIRTALGEAAEEIAKAGIKTGYKLVKIKSTQHYLKLVQSLRAVWKTFLLMQLFLLFAANATFITLICIIYSLPISDTARLWSLGGLCALFSGASLFILIRLNSEANWMRLSHVDEMIEKIICEDQND